MTDNSKMVHHLEYDHKQVILVGTAHVSRESAQQVTSVIQDERPDTVCVELCQSRYQSIRQKERWQETDIVKIIKEKKSFLLLSNLLLASFQKRIAKKLKIKPGAEMIAAIETADEVGAAIHLADRDIRTTLSRTWREMGLWNKIKLLFQLILSLGDVDEIKEEDIEKMKQEDVLETLLAEVGKSLPILKDILINERDQYLAAKIRTAPGKKIVAVVGAGHIPGIKKNWHTDIDIQALEQLAPKKKFAGLLKWLIPAAIMALFIAGFFYGGKLTTKRLLKILGILRPNGTAEIMCHPGLCNADNDYDHWGYMWQDECNALTDEAIKDYIIAKGIDLITYRDI